MADCDHIKVTRTTAESTITVLLDDGPRDPDAKRKLNTMLPFFSHMLEQVAWRSQLNIQIDLQLDHFELAHLVTEDVGITLGRAIKEYVDRHYRDGLVGYGSAFGIIDEAMTRAVISFESRALLDFTTGPVDVPEQVEGMKSEDMIAFFEGFVQGAQCTLHLDLLKGRDRHGHHIWESAFRALGMALQQVMVVSPWRKDMSAGVCGNIQYQIE